MNNPAAINPPNLNSPIATNRKITKGKKRKPKNNPYLNFRHKIRKSVLRG